MVVTDLQLPDGHGLDIVRSVREVSNTTGVVVLTMHAGDDQIFAAMEAGASGLRGQGQPRRRGHQCRQARRGRTTHVPVLQASAQP